MNTLAKKLSLDEIKDLPVGTVIWRAYTIETENGIVWHGTSPAMICVAGIGGYLIGGDEAGTFDYGIDDRLMEDPIDSFWNSEPTDEQLPGISKIDFNALTDDESIVLPKLAAAITSKGFGIDRFCNQIGLDYDSFWNAITGKREFDQWEIVGIRTALKLTDDEVMKIFFPAALAQI